MENCIYCGKKVGPVGDCPSCQAKNPMVSRETEMTLEYATKLRQMEKELPERLVMEGTPINTPMLGFIVGLISVAVFGLLGYYLVQQYEKEKKRERLRSSHEQVSPQERYSDK
ncbi:MAG: hypothetical protein AABZ60_13085 [Planctomycetota bacterium]